MLWEHYTSANIQYSRIVHPWPTMEVGGDTTLLHRIDKAESTRSYLQIDYMHAMMRQWKVMFMVHFTQRPL